MIGITILKIDSEIAEIFEVKDGTRHLEINILLLHRSRKIILLLQVATLTSIIFAISKSILKILVPIMCKFPDFFKTDKIPKKQSGSNIVYLDYSLEFCVPYLYYSCDCSRTSLCWDVLASRYKPSDCLLVQSMHIPVLARYISSIHRI